MADKSANNLRDLFLQHQLCVLRSGGGIVFLPRWSRARQNETAPEGGLRSRWTHGHGFKIATRSPGGTQNPARFISQGVTVGSNYELSDLMI